SPRSRPGCPATIATWGVDSTFPSDRTLRGTFELKQPNRAMVGARASPNNRPVRPRPSRVTDRPVLRRTSFCSARLSGFGLEKGTHGGTTQDQRQDRGSELPPHRRGGRYPARLAQDGLPVGQGGQAALPQDPGRAPALSRGQDPRARQRPEGGAHRLGLGTTRGGHSAHVVHGAVLVSWTTWAVPSSRRWSPDPGPRARYCRSRNRPASSITVP